METKGLTRRKMAQMLSAHPDGSMPRIFEAALSGYTTRTDSEVQGPADAVCWALDCCIAFLAVEQEA
jgi:hypothetical protein